MARSLQVVLMEDLPNVGNTGELVKVKPGYARNFLIPRGLAAIATKDNVRRLEHAKRVAQARAAKNKVVAEEFALKLNGVSLSFEAQVGEEGKLFGSITSRDIADKLAELGHEVDRRKIVMDPIKEAGTVEVLVKVAGGVDAHVKVVVVGKGGEAEAGATEVTEGE